MSGDVAAEQSPVKIFGLAPCCFRIMQKDRKHNHAIWGTNCRNIWKKWTVNYFLNFCRVFSNWMYVTWEI